MTRTRHWVRRVFCLCLRLENFVSNLFLITIFLINLEWVEKTRYSFRQSISTGRNLPSVFQFRTGSPTGNPDLDYTLTTRTSQDLYRPSGHTNPRGICHPIFPSLHRPLTLFLKPTIRSFWLLKSTLNLSLHNTRLNQVRRHHFSDLHAPFIPSYLW